jgi:hypothetical protein
LCTPESFPRSIAETVPSPSATSGAAANSYFNLPYLHLSRRSRLGSPLPSFQIALSQDTFVWYELASVPLIHRHDLKWNVRLQNGFVSMSVMVLSSKGDLIAPFHSIYSALKGIWRFLAYNSGIGMSLIYHYIFALEYLASDA